MTSSLCDYADLKPNPVFFTKTKFNFKYFIIDHHHYRVHEDGTCEEPLYYGDKVTSWNECPVPKILTAFLLKLHVAPNILTAS